MTLRSLIIIEGVKMMTDWREPIHPGEILAEELHEIGMTAVELARRIDVPDNRIYQIIHGKRNITADTALRLGKFFNTSAEYWLNLQKLYELDVARQGISSTLDAIQPFRPPQAVHAVS